MKHFQYNFSLKARRPLTLFWLFIYLPLFIAAQSGEQCFVSTTLPNVAFAKSVWSTNGDTITIRTTFSRKFVDNTYGTTAIGWPNGHKFSDLVGSDNLQLSLLNNSGVKVLEFKLDYVTASTAAPSGYKCLGVSGGEGKMLVGTATNIYGASSSIDVNLNKFGYKLLTNSPSSNLDYVINSTYPNWIYEVWYEVKVKKSAFGTSGFKSPLITGIHASPSKLGTNTVTVTPQPCPVGSLGDRVWLDENRNGIQDIGETGVKDVIVKLYSCQGNTLLATDITDAQGKYLFENLEVDKGYYLVFDKSSMPLAAEITSKDAGANDANDSDADPVSGQTACETITANENNLTYDAGIYVPRSSIGNFVWEDKNMDGKQDAGEPGISGVVVYLYSCDGMLKGSTFTNGNGFYLFENLVPGSYYLSFVSPGEEYVPTPGKQGNDGSKDSDADPDSGNTVCESLEPGENNPDYDAGFFKCSVSITCPPMMTVQCSDHVPEPATGLVNTFGVCGGVTVDWRGDQTTGTGCLVNVVRTYLATDQFGFNATCQQTIQIRDTEAPTLTGSSGKTVSCTNEVSFDEPIAQDNCDESPLISIVSTVSSQGSCAGLYTVTRTWRATDACGNLSSTVSQTMTVNDLAPPAISSPGESTSVSCHESVVFTPPTATDECDMSPNIILVSDVTIPGSCAGLYSRTKRWKAVDCSGNESATVAQTISVIDNTPPSIGSPGSNTTISCPNAPVFTPPSASDECDGSPQVVLVSDVTKQGACPGTYTRTKTWKAVDCSGNESATVAQTISVIDNTPPSIGSPGNNTTISCPNAPVFTPPSANDECDGSPDVLLISDVTIPGACPGTFTQTKTWKAVDCTGNESASRSQSISVIDNTPPVIGNAGPAKYLSCAAPIDFDEPSVTDECGAAELVVVSENTEYSECATGFIGSPYSITRTWKAVDCSGNESPTRSQTLYFDCCVDDNPPICLTSTTNPSKVGGLITMKTTGDTVTIRVTFNKTFVDNTYGTSAIGWPKGHTFSNLTGSDKLQLALFDKGGTKKMEFVVDYISSSSLAPSGYKCLGVTGGEGSMILGSASQIYSAETSIDRNLNKFGYVLLSNSPATDQNYSANASYPNWIYDVWYEVKVKKSVFGEVGFGKPLVTSIHASPSKTGNNTEPVIECSLVTVAVTDEQCIEACTGEINLTGTSGLAPYTFKWNDGNTSEDRSNLCPGNYSVTVTDANGSVASTNITIQAAPVIPCPEQKNEICFESPTKPNIVNAKSTWTEKGDTVIIITTLSKTFVDNTYGTGAIGWSGGHKFGDLTGSDQLTIALYDSNKSKKLEFAMDYLSSASGTPSGYKSLGVAGGDGKMISGSAGNVYGVLTSLDVNFNKLGYKLTTNSPLTNASYTPNATYPNWIYEVWYEVKVKKSAFGTAGFGYPIITNMHASPSKTGSNTEVVVVVDCAANNNDNIVEQRSHSGASYPQITELSVQPNPAVDFANVTFSVKENGITNVVLYTLEGKVVQTIFSGEADAGQKYSLQTDLGDIPPGMYLVKLQSGHSQVMKKLIIGQ